MKLPFPGMKYDQRAEIERNRQLERADLENLKSGRDLELAGGRLILASPDGTRYAVVVGDDGTLSTELVNVG